MKTCYYTKVSEWSIAIADLTKEPSGVFVLNRINVPAKHRGKGHGSDLLRTVLREADKHGVTIRLDVHASGPLTSSQLERWYERNGFKCKGGTCVRKPQQNAQSNDAEVLQQPGVQ